jgi:hypothetical protein
VQVQFVAGRGRHVAGLAALEQRHRNRALGGQRLWGLLQRGVEADRLPSKSTFALSES